MMTSARAVIASRKRVVLGALAFFVVAGAALRIIQYASASALWLD
jgi:hypothetical protein